MTLDILQTDPAQGGGVTGLGPHRYAGGTAPHLAFSW